MKFWCLQISPKANQILDRFLPYEMLGEKYVKHLVGFLGDLKTPKFHSEVNWPLIIQFHYFRQEIIKKYLATFQHNNAISRKKNLINSKKFYKMKWFLHENTPKIPVKRIFIKNRQNRPNLWLFFFITHMS